MLRPIALSLVLLALACPRTGRAAPDPAPSGGPLGLVLTTDLGGGVRAGGDAPHGLFEGEIGVGYEFPVGLRPELALVIGMAPSAHVGLRPGLHFELPDVPIYVRGALDWSTQLSDRPWRWLLLGAGAELRLTGLLGGFVEADLGLPLGRDIGVGILFRAGFSFRL